jgi:anti-sigma factor RsiW
MIGRIKCTEASRRLSRQLEEPLPPGQKLALMAHLAACTHCRRFSRQVRILRKAFRRLGTDDFEAPKP